MGAFVALGLFVLHMWDFRRITIATQNNNIKNGDFFKKKNTFGQVAWSRGH